MLDFLMSNSGLLMGGTGGGIALYILKKVPNKEICGWVESICYSAGKVMTLGLSKWKFTKGIWNKTIEPWFVDLLDNFIGSAVRGFIKGVTSRLMPYKKTKDGSLVNEVTLGDGYPLSNDLQPLKIGGEASILGISSPLPDGSDSGLFRVDGDLDITGTLKTKLSHDLIYDFDDEVNTLAQVKIDALIDSAPAALDTLNELAAALGDDASFATTVTNSLALKAPLAAPAFTGNATFDSTTLTIDATNNRVGIGTASPAELLHVASETDPTLVLQCPTNNQTNSGTISFRESGTTDQMAIKYNGSTNNLIIDTSSVSNAFVLQRADGHIGIGTDSPATTLDVEGTVSYKHTAFTTAGPTDNVDVSDTTVLEVDTSSNNVTIGGFTGGVQGQILYIVKTDTANFIQLEHNEGGGSQDIFLTSGSDDRVVGYGGFTLYCNGTSWFSLSNPTGAADAG